MTQFNKLTPAEAERLALLAEECGEVIQAIGKILRHGYESTHPDGGPTNREALERECGDLRHAVLRLQKEGDLSVRAIHGWSNAKAQNIERYLHHQSFEEVKP